MDHGEVQQFADPDTVYNRPANLFVARFMGAPPMNTLPARVEIEAGKPVVVLGNGEIRLPLPNGPSDARAWRDRAVILGIRPECISEPDRRHDDDATLIEAKVELTERTGAETIALIRLAGHEALARVAPDVNLPIGALSRFALDTRKICLFDPKTERLIV